MRGDTPPASTASTFRPVGELLAQWKARDPQRPALVEVDEGGRITFGELADAVDGTAARLMRVGIDAGHRVVLIPRTGIETIVLWFALWRLGAIVCPLDLAFLRQGGRGVLELLDPRCVVVGADLKVDATFDAVAARLLRHDGWPGRGLPVAIDGTTRDDDLDSVRRALAARRTPGLADLACIACTSGTTGRPKLVVYDHHAYWQNGLDSALLTGLSARDRLFEYRSFGWYSAQILTLMPFLQTGLTVHLARRFSFQNFARWIEENRITVCVGVPSVINMLVHASEGPSVARLASLRLMTSSTAPLNTSHWFRFEERYGVRLLNLYGSSEGGWICGNRLDARRIGTVGRALDSVRLALVGDDGSARDARGQAQVTTAKIAVGYLQRDGSIESLRDRPLLLRDVLARDADGFIRILGRSDDIINRGGIKFAPAEIEEVLLTHGDVREAAVVGVPDAIRGQEPVAFVVARPDREVDVHALAIHCAAYLPREKCPMEIVAVQSLPVSARGKLQRHRLQADFEAIRRTREDPG